MRLLCTSRVLNTHILIINNSAHAQKTFFLSFKWTLRLDGPAGTQKTVKIQDPFFMLYDLTAT